MPDSHLYRVRASKRGKRVEVCALTRGTSADVVFTFYLMRDGHRVAAEWYKSEPTHTFLLEDETPGYYECIGFVKLADGSTESATSGPWFVPPRDPPVPIGSGHGIDSAPFVPGPVPFLDFAVISTAGSAVADRVQRRLERVRDFGMGIRAFGEATNRFFVVASALSRVSIGDGRVTALSGLAQRQGVMLPADVPDDFFDAPDRATGMFTSLDVTPEAASIRTDLFGMGQSFVSQHGEFAVGSNRLHLHKLILQAIGAPVALDPVAVTALLFSQDGFFSQQAALSRTLVAGVELVPVDQDVRLAAGTVRAVPKEILRETTTSDVLGYQEAVELGTQDIIRNTRAALSSERFDNIVMDLSGGKDSRLVLGTAVNVPGWRDRLTINSRDIPDSDDLAIALGIVARYGARFYEGSDAPQVSQTYQDASELWRSFFLGMYNRFGASPWSNAGTDTRTLTLAGGAGEVYRASWSSSLRSHLARSRTSLELADSLVSSAAVAGGFPDARLAELTHALATEFDSFPSNDLAGKLEDHYLFHRDRTHFGMRQFATHLEHPAWFPLLSPHLLIASRALPVAERATGRVIHDVLDRLEPTLTRLPFDGGDPFANLPGIAGRPPLDIDVVRGPWERAEARAAAKLPGRRGGSTSSWDWAQFWSFLRDQAVTAVIALRTNLRVDDDLLPADLTHRIDAAFQRSPRAGAELAMRVLAIYDVVTPMEPPRA